jgi:tripartite motif-containing protein 71
MIRRRPRLTVLSMITAVTAVAMLATGSVPLTASAAAPLNPVLQGYLPNPFISGHAGIYPWGMATMSDGNIAVGDYWNQKVWLYAPDGTVLNANLVNNVGFAAGQTQSPYGMAVDPINGDLYIADTDRYMVHRYAYNPSTHSATQQNWWGSSGNGTQLGRYMYPRTVTVDENHNVYIIDTWANNAEVDHIDVTAPACTTTCPPPQTLEKFAGKGSLAGQFKQPHGEAIYYGGDGSTLGAVQNDRLYVADDGNKRVDVFVWNSVTGLIDKPDTAEFGSTASFGCAKATGNPACHFSGDLRGLAIDQTRGFLYVTDAAGNNVDMFDLNGNWIKEIGKKSAITNTTGQELEAPGYFTDGGRELTVEPASGYVWVGDMPDFRVQVFDPSQTTFATQIKFIRPDPANLSDPALPLLPAIGGFNGPRGVAVDQNGNVAVTDTYNQRVERWDATANTWTTWGSRGRGDWAFNYPRLLAIDPNDGSIVVADTDNHLIKKFANDGSSLIWKVGGAGSKTSPLQFRNPHGIDVGPDGTVYVADSKNDRIIELNGANGSFIRAFGTLGTGNGQFKFPRGVVLDDNGTPGNTSDDTLWVVDWTQDTVQHFTLTGGFLGKFGSKCTTVCNPNQFNGAFDIAATGGYLFIADSSQHFVRAWTNPCYGSSNAATCTLVPSYLLSIGKGRGKQTDGHMIQPQGLDVSADGRYLYVAEQGNDRVSIWDLYAP